MSHEFYAPDVLQESRRMYDGIRQWATHNEATIIGGWAVFETVQERTRRQSRDIDLVLHTVEACQAFSDVLPTLGLAWGQDQRGRRMECHRRDDDEKGILVDVFTPAQFHSFFKWHSGANIKDPPNGLIASYPFLLNDKIATVPKRQDRDAGLKKAKDLVDIRDLVYFNRNHVLPAESLKLTDRRARELAAFQYAVALEAAPGFHTELGEAREWLLKH